MNTDLESHWPSHYAQVPISIDHHRPARRRRPIRKAEEQSHQTSPIAPPSPAFSRTDDGARDAARTAALYAPPKQNGGYKDVTAMIEPVSTAAYQETASSKQPGKQRGIIIKIKHVLNFITSYSKILTKLLGNLYIQ